MGQIKRIHEMLVKGEITCTALTQKYLDEIENSGKHVTTLNLMLALPFVINTLEGFEKQVLQGMDWNYRPWVFCMESTKPNTEIPCHEEWEHILLEHGYTLIYTHGINRYYIDADNHNELLNKEIRL